MRGFEGLFQSDDFSTYETLVKNLPGVRRGGCAAHARRRCYQAALEGDRQAIWFIGRFRQLYRIEDEVRDKTPEERQAIRQALAPAIWAEMKIPAEQLRPVLLPQSSLGKAIRYYLNGAFWVDKPKPGTLHIDRISFGDSIDQTGKIYLLKTI